MKTPLRGIHSLVKCHNCECLPREIFREGVPSVGNVPFIRYECSCGYIALGHGERHLTLLWNSNRLLNRYAFNIGRHPEFIYEISKESGNLYFNKKVPKRIRNMYRMSQSCRYK